MRYLIIRLGKNSKSNVGAHFYEQREIWLPVFSNEFERLLNSGFHVIECSVSGGEMEVNTCQN